MSQLSHVENHRRSWNGIRRGRGGNVPCHERMWREQVTFYETTMIVCLLFFL